jgi:hypothetical protein
LNGLLARAGGRAMRARHSDESGFSAVKLQAIVIVGVVALLGLVVVPVWVSQAAGPREVTLAANVNTVAKLYTMALAEGPGASPLTTPGPEAAAALRASLQRPVTNQLTHSSAVVAGDDWRAGGTAPGVWITSRPEGSPGGLAEATQTWRALAGTVIVYVGPDLAVDVYAVSTTGARLDLLQHLAGS